MTKAPHNIIDSMSIDCIIFGFEDQQLKILLYERAIEPEKDKWALPGGFIYQDESLDDAAARILEETTGVKDIYMQQTHTFGQLDRYPLNRVITVAYFALINPGNYSIKAGRFAKSARWFNIKDKSSLTFDHDIIFDYALDRLRKIVRYKPIGFELLPKKFTLTLLQKLYESILDTEFDVRNFRKKIHKMDLLIKLDEKQKGVAHRAAYLYKFDKKMYKSLQERGFVFDL